MAADHGVAEEGVSAYPQEVTRQMVLNFRRGGAAINVLARHAGARLVVMDMGVKGDCGAPHQETFFVHKIAPGTRNFAREAAMTRAQAAAALQTGIEIVQHEVARGAEMIATGDMGIANTSASSAIVAAMTGRDPAEVTGRGTGITEAAHAKKVEVIRAALKLHGLALNAPRSAGHALDVLAKVGGFEIGGLAGVILGAAAARRPVVLDGFISGAAALIAWGLCPKVSHFCFAAHQSVEAGHRVALEALELEPLVDFDLRLGEGTGAALAMHLIEAAARIYHEMATFGEAGVSEKSAG
jgi:nicotinate-nucleotide--dimethylbenzimidazole phosphoribosyltransferase